MSKFPSRFTADKNVCGFSFEKKKILVLEAYPHVLNFMNKESIRIGTISVNYRKGIALSTLLGNMSGGVISMHTVIKIQREGNSVLIYS